MMQKPTSCQGCALFNIGTGFSITEGRCSNGVLIIGESLGSNEVIEALPFRPYAEAGSALQTAFRFLGLDRSNFMMWNLIGCQPPYNTLEGAEYEEEAILHCRKAHFDRVIAKAKPKVILALGNLPLKWLWKRDPKIDEYIASMPEDTKEEKKAKRKYLAGLKIGQLRGYTFDSVYGIPLIASFHPSFITQQKGRTQLGTLMQDITKAISIARNGVPKFETQYIEDPSVEDAIKFYEECKADPTLLISHDVETPLTALEVDESEIEFENQEVREINSIQFSIKIGTGIFFPMYGEFETIAEKILSLENPKIGWNNWKFDETNIEYKYGKGSIKGTIHDGMWMWKWANQDFVKTGRALQFATPFAAIDFPAWKFYGPIYPKRYGCNDVDAPLRIFKYLYDFFVKKRLPNIEAKSLYEGYIDDIVNLRPILKDITKRGFPIDVEAREEFATQIELEQQKILTELQEMYPTELRRLDPLEGYKTIPNEVLEAEELFKQASNINNDGLFYVLDDTNNQLYNLRLAQYIEKHSRRENTTGLVLKEFDFEGFKVKRYCRMEEFKPGSSQQVLKYLKFKKYKIPKKRSKKGESETTSKDQLMPLYEETGDQLLYKTIYLRELDHLLAYVGKGKGKGEGWKLGSDNRVHAEFLFIPSTGQLSSSPNIQNAPARGTRYSSEGYENLAKLFRKTVAAKPNHILVSADWSAFHINTLAFEAEDETYMRIGRLDPHSYLTAYMLQSSLPAKVNKLKMKKPTNQSQEDWLKECNLHEEAIDRIKSINVWLQLSDDDLRKELSWFKKNYEFERNAQAKRALLGMGFGMKVNRFFKENRHAFTSKSEPERILKLIKKLFPKTFVDYHEYIKNLADKQTYLLTRYGSIRRFYDVYDWRLLPKPRTAREGELIIKNSKGQLWLRKDGQSSNEAIAYLPSNDAFGKKKEAMRDLNHYIKDGIIRNINEEFRLINEIHDDLMFEMPQEKLEEGCKILKEVMESPARFLKNSIAPNGLITRVEIKCGSNWANMKEIKI